MDLHWLEQTESDVPAGNDWLSPGETLRLDAMRFPKRRADWRLGRWTAKCAAAACLSQRYPLADIEIRAAASGAPEVFCANQPAALAISLSHCSGVACCAVIEGAATLGCDLERIEPRSPAFIADYLTTEEQTLMARACAADRPQLATLLWSAKESALKALRVGLRQDTRSVIVEDPALGGSPSSGSDTWRPLWVRHTDGDFHGWWQSRANLVRTVVAAPSPNPPKSLNIPRAVQY